MKVTQRASEWLLQDMAGLYGAFCELMKWRANGDYGADPLTERIPVWSPPVVAPNLPVLQRYPNTEMKKTDVTFRCKRLQLALEGEPSRSPLDFLDGSGVRHMNRKKALSGIAPNFVHSLDSAHLMLTVLAAAEEGIADIAVIHDSFGTHAADTDCLSRLLRETS